MSFVFSGFFQVLRGPNPQKQHHKTTLSCLDNNTLALIFVAYIASNQIEAIQLDAITDLTGGAPSSLVRIITI